MPRVAVVGVIWVPRDKARFRGLKRPLRLSVGSSLIAWQEQATTLELSNELVEGIKMTRATRPSSLRMKVNIGMLDALGVGMYETIGQSLVEFVANGHDADATKVEITMPFELIAEKRKEARDEAKKEGADLKEGVYVPLPDSISISISDDGHGMSAEELEDKFLLLSRNRREDSKTSESGKRKVMGRKGLGKLAGFGAAEQVVVCSKRKGETHSTTIVMDYNEIAQKQQVDDVDFEPTYEEGLEPDHHGTTITLKRLRCDSLKRSEDALTKTLRRNFANLGDAFSVHLNGNKIEAANVEYEYAFPETLDSDGLAEFAVDLEDDETFPIRAVVKFRARGVSDQTIERGSLPATERGARVYCKGRLAAGPTLFDLPTGMHNFHSQAYMEAIVYADILDDMHVDLISTNRKGLKSDNDVVDAFIAKVTSIMKDAIYGHGKFRDNLAREQLEEKAKSNPYIEQVLTLPASTRGPARKLLETLGAREGFESDIFKEVAPYFVGAINSSEVLVELIKSGTSPSDLKTVIGQLNELSEIERKDVLKLYRARRSGIDALQKLEERSHDKGPKYEKELHQLLKDNVWLIRPEFGTYLTSDDTTAHVVRKLNAALEIDTNASGNPNLRPDLVFLAIDREQPTAITIVELKSPNVPLSIKHLDQLKGYMADVEETLSQDFPLNQVRVRGHLIGNFAKPDSQARGPRRLRQEMERSGASEHWEVLSVPALLERARQAHMQVIEALDDEDPEKVHAAAE